MIDFIDISEGHILLCEGAMCVSVGNTAESVANAIMQFGGPAPVIYKSSSCDFAKHYGFESQKAFDDLWDDVCELL